MRHLPLLLGLVVIVALTVHDLYQFFVTDAGVGYFSSEPRRLLYVVLLGVAGGIVASMISRFSPGSQRKLKLAVLGGFAAFLTCFLGLLVYHLAQTTPMVTKAGIWGWVIAATLSFAAVTVLVWWEFRQVWRSHEPCVQPLPASRPGTAKPKI
jgi:FtsH-binding integral membrane protein